MKKPKIEKYAESYKLRAITSAVPYIGGALDILLSKKGEKIRERRINELFANINDRLEKIEDKESLDEYLNTEEFYDLFIKVLNTVIRTRHSEKINGYANILINHLTTMKSENENSELMVNTLDSLVTEELNYLSDLYNNDSEIILYKVFGIYLTKEKLNECIKETNNAPSNKNEIPQDYHYENSRMIIWKFLSDKNIIEIHKKEGFGSLPYNFGSSNMMVSGSTNYSEITKYKLSEFGEEFIKWFIKE